MSTLRARRHNQTRTEIVDAAFRLFAEKGYSEVTMEEIAAAAGISRSTVYRRFPTKEDVVLDVPTRWLDAFDEAAAALPDDATLAEAFSITSQAVATYIDANIERAMASYAILEEAPTLKVSGVATTQWLQRMVTLAETYGGPATADDKDRAAILAGAYLGGIDAMMFQWASNGGTESVVAATKRLHGYLEPLLD
jgi:AcrR family transcriptional regulator